MVQRRFRIMVVDSHPALRMQICSQLRELGYDDLTCAHNGPSALARLKAEPMDAVIMGVESTDGGGLEALAAIRADPALRDLPVVVVTARADRETVKAGLALGVSGYLIKPPTAAAIGTCLSRALWDNEDIERSGRAA